MIEVTEQPPQSATTAAATLQLAMQQPETASAAEQLPFGLVHSILLDLPPVQQATAGRLLCRAAAAALPAASLSAADPDLPVQALCWLYNTLACPALRRKLLAARAAAGDLQGLARLREVRGRAAAAVMRPHPPTHATLSHLCDDCVLP